MLPDYNVKYLENGERYDVGLIGGQIGNHPWAFDWHHNLWPWMTLNLSSSNFKVITITVKYFDNGVWNTTTLGRYTFHRTYFLLHRTTKTILQANCILTVPAEAVARPRQVAAQVVTTYK